MARVFVGVGSNVDPADNVRKGLQLLAREMRVTAVSTVYETEPEGHRRQPRYYNCVVEVETGAPPAELKRALRGIEERLGRVRGRDRYASRRIDLDLLAYDEMSVQTPDLTLPDPDVATRAHLATALAELAPSLMLPGIGMTAVELAESMSEQGMRALDEYTAALRKEVTHAS
jgi:2-amino-4-hydroxy-6-hydroxymethyldihydropteridine diphosphokinase